MLTRQQTNELLTRIDDAVYPWLFMLRTIYKHVVILTWNDLDPFYFLREDWYNMKVILVWITAEVALELHGNYACHLLNTLSQMLHPIVDVHKDSHFSVTNREIL